MKALSDLISTVQPSLVAIQSGVLVLFMSSFVFVVLRLLGDTKRKQCDDLGSRMLGE
jgi:hypothetical protein